jgi:hypothetical protein
MTKFYPTRNDLDSPDKVERIVKDIYDKIYMPIKTKPKKAASKRVNVNTGRVTAQK